MNLGNESYISRIDYLFRANIPELLLGINKELVSFNVSTVPKDLNRTIPNLLPISNPCCSFHAFLRQFLDTSEESYEMSDFVILITGF